jgi:LysM repeat protein
VSLDSITHLLPGVRVTVPKKPQAGHRRGLLERRLQVGRADVVDLVALERVSSPIRTAEDRGVDAGAIARTTVLPRAAIALAASAVFFGGVGSAVMHEAMPMSSTMKNQRHQMTNGETMTGTMPPSAANATTVAPTMPVSPGRSAAGRATLPTADLGPVRPGGPGQAMPLRATARTAQTSAGTTGSTTRSSSSSATARSTTSTSASSSRAMAGHVVTTVRSGDDFGAVGSRYGISAERVAALNPGVDPTQLSIGRTLRVR